MNEVKLKKWCKRNENGRLCVGNKYNYTLYDALPKFYVYDFFSPGSKQNLSNYL